MANVQINIDRTCRIERFDGFDRFVKAFKVYDPGRSFDPAFKSGRWDGSYSFVTPAGQFRLGLLKTVIAEVHRLGHRPVANISGDFRIGGYVPSLFDADDHLRDYQRKSVQLMRRKVVGVFVLPTSAGKTEIILDYARCHPGVRILYLCTRSLLVVQTADRAEKYLGEPVNILGGGHHSFDRSRTFTCAVDKTAFTWLSSGRIKDKDFDVVIVDECHRVSADTMRNILQKLKWHRLFGFSGSYPTIKRNVIKHWRVKSLVGSPILEITDKAFNAKYGDAVGGFIPEINVYRVLNTVEIPRWVSGQEIYKALTECETRNRIIVELSKHLGRGVLVVVNHSRQGRLLIDLMERESVNSEFIEAKVGGSGCANAIHRLDTGVLNCLVSTPVIDEGISVNNIRHIIYAAAGKSEIQVIQRLGRGKRTKSTGRNVLSVWDFADLGHARCAKNARQRFEVYDDLVETVHSVMPCDLREEVEQLRQY